jgi:hypothetical protein
MTDLVYALLQLVHNLGAAAVIGVPLVALTRERCGMQPSRRLAALLVTAWIVPAASGVGFGIASLRLKGQLPEIAGVALAALAVKLGGTAVGLATAALALWKGGAWAAPLRRRAAWLGLGAAALPLAAAAFLRWYL